MARSILSIMSLSIMSVLFVIGYSVAVVAADDDSDLVPEVQSDSGISYVSGGIGDQSQQAMDEMADDFNLQLTFAQEQGGNYLADVPVMIQDEQGSSVLEVVSQGPIFYAELEPGMYTVMVSSEGEVHERQVEVQSDSPSMIHFAW